MRLRAAIVTPGLRYEEADRRTRGASRLRRSSTAEFALALVFKQWRPTIGIGAVALGTISVLQFLYPGALPTLYPYNVRWFILVEVVVFVFLVKAIKDAHTYFEAMDAPMPALRFVRGEGRYDGKIIVVMQRTRAMEAHTCLTLYCGSSGAEQPLCIMVTLPTHDDVHVLAEPLWPIDKLRPYFEEESRRQRLYALPYVSADMLDEIGRLKVVVDEQES